jgi:dolichol-phosphate mannosyltransferase
MYNEAANVEESVRAVLAAIPAIPLSTSVIFVNDGSRDATGPKLDGLRSQRGGFTIVHKTNGGYGSALLAGAREGERQGCDYALFMDSDMTNPPAHIARFVPALMEGVDLIKSCRFCEGGDMDAVPWRRRIFSEAGNIVGRMLFRVGVKDCTTGFRAIRISLLKQIPFSQTGFPSIMEELYWAKRLGASFANVPTSLGVRDSNSRETTFPYSLATILGYLKPALRASLIRYTPD